MSRPDAIAILAKRTRPGRKHSLRHVAALRIFVRGLAATPMAELGSAIEARLSATEVQLEVDRLIAHDPGLADRFDVCGRPLLGAECTPDADPDDHSLTKES